MTTYKVVCKILSSDGERIQTVGLTDDTLTDIATSSATPKEINQKIGNGDRCFFTNEAGTQVEVEQFGDNFIRTKADGTVRNNLRHLRDCNFKS